jgi:LytS/YehU family sensor histidine kinase
MVGLDKEIDYVNNYIDLQLLRLTDRIDIQYEITGEPAGYEIAPFLLIPFVENAFKYGVNSEDNSRIAITLDVQGGVLKLRVTNNKVYLKPNMEHQTGLGIQTTKRRLELLYAGRYTLEILDDSKLFDVVLTITLG